MWLLDQMTVVPELWAAFAGFSWWSEPEPVDAGGEVFVLLRDAAASVAGCKKEIQSVYDTIRTTVSVPKHNLNPLVFEALKLCMGDKYPTKPNPLFTAVVTSFTGLNVRSGPGLSFPVVGTQPRGTRLDVWAFEQADGYTWAKIGDQAWVADKYLGKL
jgi:uncharacterized protein YgiM (DUF1202 family)